MPLKEYSTDQLLTEINKRKKAQRPILLTCFWKINCDKSLIASISPLRKICEKYLDYIESSDYCDGDDNEWSTSIYEATLTMLYGESIWDFIDHKNREIIKSWRSENNDEQTEK